MKESQLQRKIIADLKQRGAYVIKTIVSNRNGVPDLFFCYQGRFYALEVKKEDGTVTDLQRVNIEHIKKAGGSASAIFTWEQYINFREVEGI
jgi:Holliday junction resolvase